MDLDLTKLTRGPLAAFPNAANADPAERYSVDGVDATVSDSFRTLEDAEFYTVARNAFDIMMRRGWGVQRVNGHWVAVNEHGQHVWNHVIAARPDLPKPFHLLNITCPLSALVETDAWYREHVEHAR